MTINVLSDELISKIAAGEVVERPASIVKEVLENAIDAKPTEIEINIVDGGISEIRITDDGIGIAKEDLPLSLQRHATSKITSENDLHDIHTMGFRGEALAAIDAACDVTITSLHKSAQTAYSFSNGNLQAAAHNTGTTVSAKNLFSKTPARLKFLKSARTEAKACHDVVFAYALVNPNISFTYTQQNEVVFSAPQHKDIAERTQYLIPEHGVHIKKISSQHPSQQKYKVNGCFSQPEVKEKNRKYQFIYCNGRFIKSPMISAAISKAYETYIPGNVHGVVILDLQIPAKDLDVNVHPAKTTIKFSEESHVFSAVYHAIRDGLVTHAQPQISQPSQHTLFGQEKVHDSRTEIKSQVKQYTNFNDHTAQSEIKTSDTQLENPFSKETEQYSQATTEESTNNQNVINSASEQDLARKYIGTINKTYFIFEVPEGIALIDFHAAYERLAFEEFEKKFTESTVSVQHLVEPHIVELSSAKMQQAMSNKEHFATLGILFDEFGPQTISISQMPVIMGKLVSPDLIIESIATEIKNVDVFHKEMQRMIATKACKASPRAGDTVSQQEALQLFDDLFANGLSWTCPHGRPVMLLLNHEQLAKMFLRH